MADITNKRNEFGVKYSCDQYRTFGGEHYVCWLFGFGAEIASERAAEYRLAGIKCRRVGEDLYVRYDDCNKAGAMDAERGWPTN